MKALTVSADIASKRKWAKPIYLVELRLPGLTLRFSDDVRTKLGQTWTDGVIAFGTIAESMNSSDAGGRPNVWTGLQLANSKPIGGKARLSSLMRTTVPPLAGTFEFIGAEVRLYMVFEELDTGHEVLLGTYYVEDHPIMTEDYVEFRMSDKTLLIEDQIKIGQLIGNLFPNADPDDLGKDIPVPIGNVPDVVALGAITGVTTTITRGMTATVPAVGAWQAVGDVSRLPALGIAGVDDETIEWSSTRVVGGVPEVLVKRRTNPAPHAAGATFFQLRTGPKAYGFIVGENVPPYYIEAVSNIRVNGVLQEQATVVLNDTTLVPGRSFAVIYFPALPQLKRQVKLAIDDKLTVGDNIAVASTNRFTRRYQGDAPFYMFIGINSPGQFGAHGFATITIGQPPIAETPITVSRELSVSVQADRLYIGSFEIWSNLRGRLVWHGILDGRGNLNAADIGKTFARAFSYPTGANKLNDTITLYFNQVFGIGRIIFGIDGYSINIDGTVAVAKSGNASRAGSISLTGNSTADVVIGGPVTCDVKGVRDDGAGTITGTAAKPIRNLTDVGRFYHLALFPGIVAGDLGTTWTASRAFHEAGGYKVDFLATRLRYSEVRKKLGEQGRAVCYVEAGKFEYRVFTFNAPTRVFAAEFPVDPRGDLGTFEARSQAATAGFITPPKITPPAQLILDYTDDVWEELAASPSRTPRQERVNSLRVYCARDYRKSGSPGDMYRIARTVEVPGLTPATRFPRDLELEWVRDAVMATRVAEIWRDQWKRQRWIVETVVFLNALLAEKYDLVQFINHPILVDHGPLVFRIFEKEYLLGEDDYALIRLKMIEANP